MTAEEEFKRIKSGYSSIDELIRGINIERKMLKERNKRLDELEQLARSQAR